MSTQSPTFINMLIASPKKMFLVDALGALITSSTFIIILIPLVQYFGMPLDILYLFAGIACCLLFYSTSCYLLIKSNWKPYLWLVLIFNTSYMVVSLIMVLIHYEKLTKLGVLYFVLELFVIGFVVYLEYRTITQLKKPTETFKPNYDE